MKNEEDYVFEEHQNADGTSYILMKMPDGLTVCKSTYDHEKRLVERVDYDKDGHIAARALYDHDSQEKPKRTTSFDADGNLVFIQIRGHPPVFYGEYQAGKPAFMCADQQRDRTDPS